MLTALREVTVLIILVASHKWKMCLSGRGVIKVENSMQGVDWDQAKFMIFKVSFVSIKIVV